jgi:hypothetical protein
MLVVSSMVRHKPPLEIADYLDILPFLMGLDHEMHALRIYSQRSWGSALILSAEGIGIVHGVSGHRSGAFRNLQDDNPPRIDQREAWYENHER